MYRFAFLRWCTYALLCWLCLFAFVAPAAAQDSSAPSAADAIPVATLTEAGIAAVFSQANVAAPQFVPANPGTPRRPKPLVPLYVSFASLQALDVHSTARALDRGAVEANPIMKGIAGNALAMSAVKVAGSAGVIYAAEKMWKKKNRKAAVIFMLAANAGMALIVQHNYRVQ